MFENTGLENGICSHILTYKMVVCIISWYNVSELFHMEAPSSYNNDSQIVRGVRRLVNVLSKCCVTEKLPSKSLTDTDMCCCDWAPNEKCSVSNIPSCIHLNETCGHAVYLLALQHAWFFCTSSHVDFTKAGVAAHMYVYILVWCASGNPWRAGWLCVM